MVLFESICSQRGPHIHNDSTSVADDTTRRSMTFPRLHLDLRFALLGLIFLIWC